MHENFENINRKDLKVIYSINKSMDSQTATEQIVDNKEYSLEVSSQGTALTLKLMIKVSKNKNVAYQITLNSWKDVQKLGE